MITPNDTLCSKEIQNIDNTNAPIINDKIISDTTYHNYQNVELNRITPLELYKLDKRKFAKSYLMTQCSNCGHMHPISRRTWRQLKDEVKKEWYRNMIKKMTPQQIRDRNLKGGITRALKAGQTLKPSTIKKCTGRKIYKEISNSLQIQNPTTPLM